MNPTTLLIDYDHQWIDHPLLLIFQIDDRTIHIDNTGQNHFELQKQLKLPDGEHTIKLVIKNKNESNTVIDHDHKIISDTIVNINDIAINNISIKSLVLNYDTYGFFHINNNPKQIIKKTLEFGLNGTFHLKFQLPFYDWILDTMF